MNRQVNHEKELHLADVMSDNISKGPVELGVHQRLCMEDQVRALVQTCVGWSRKFTGKCAHVAKTNNCSLYGCGPFLMSV